MTIDRIIYTLGKISVSCSVCSSHQNFILERSSIVFTFNTHKVQYRAAVLFRKRQSMLQEYEAGQNSERTQKPVTKQEWQGNPNESHLGG